jgi:hypothetical protein
LAISEFTKAVVAILVSLSFSVAVVEFVAVAAFPLILIHAVQANIFAGFILHVYIQVSVIFASLALTLLNQVLFIISHVLTSQEDKLIIFVA